MTCDHPGAVKNKCVVTLLIGQNCGKAIVGICEPGTVCDAKGDAVGVCREVVDEGEGCADAWCGSGTICIEDP
jgi:hypothetical protein